MSAEDNKQPSLGLSVRLRLVSRESDQAMQTLANICKKFGISPREAHFQELKRSLGAIRDSSQIYVLKRPPGDP